MSKIDTNAPIIQKTRVVRKRSLYRFRRALRAGRTAITAAESVPNDLI